MQFIFETETDEQREAKRLAAIAAAQERVARRRTLRQRLEALDWARSLVPLVNDLDTKQLDAMLALVASAETLDSL